MLTYVYHCENNWEASSILYDMDKILSNGGLLYGEDKDIFKAEYDLEVAKISRYATINLRNCVIHIIGVTRENNDLIIEYEPTMWGKRKEIVELVPRTIKDGPTIHFITFDVITKIPESK